MSLSLGFGAFVSVILICFPHILFLSLNCTVLHIVPYLIFVSQFFHWPTNHYCYTVSVPVLTDHKLFFLTYLFCRRYHFRSSRLRTRSLGDVNMIWIKREQTTHLRWVHHIVLRALYFIGCSFQPLRSLFIRKRDLPSIFLVFLISVRIKSFLLQNADLGLHAQWFSNLDVAVADNFDGWWFATSTWMSVSCAAK